MRIDEKTGRPVPWYQDVDGYRIPGMFSVDAFRSAVQYKPRSDDLFIATYPKCGTTWVQNIVGCIFREGKPIKDPIEFFGSTPFLELTGDQAAVRMKRPGAIKIHFPFNLAPFSTEAKYIYIARNPKDCCVSFFYHTRGPGYDFCEGQFDDFFELFIKGETDFGDYFDNLLSWYEHRNDPNILFLTYEEMKNDTEGQIMKIAEFLGPQYKDMLEKNPNIMEDVIHYSSISCMKETYNKMFDKLIKMPEEQRNHPDFPEGLRNALDRPEFKDMDNFKHEFIRKGIVGDWRNHFSEEQNSRIEAKFQDKTAGTDIPNLWKDCM